MPLDTSVVYFDSNMVSAPGMTGVAGTFVALLDACLVNGFGSVTATSVVVSSGIATVTMPGGHGFAALLSSNTCPVIVVSGATLDGLNGRKRIIAMTGVDTFTFDATGIANGAATGTISIKRAGAGWDKAFSGTNKAAYKSATLGSTGTYLRVDDTAAQVPTLIAYEAMSDIDTGTGPAPATGTLYYKKSNTADGTARAWQLFADESCFYFTSVDGSSYRQSMFFGDLVGTKATDIYHATLIAHYSSGGNNTSTVGAYGNSSGSVTMRSHTGVLGAVANMRYSHAKTPSYMCYGGVAYPDPGSGGVVLSDVDVFTPDPAAAFRGRLPGLYNPVHAYNSIANGTLSAVSIDGTSRDLVAAIFCGVAYGGVAMMDLTGPWR